MFYQEYPKVSYIVDLAGLSWNDPANICGLFGQHAVFEQFCQVLLDYTITPMSGYNYTLLNNWVKEVLTDSGGWDADGLVCRPNNPGMIQHAQYAMTNLFNQFLINNQAYVRSVLLPMILNVKDHVLVYNMGQGSVARVECV